MRVRLAEKKDYERVVDFYYTLIDKMRGSKYNPIWEKDVYPTRAQLMEAIGGQTLYIGTEKGKIVSAMVLNQKQSEGYDQVKWGVDAPPEKVCVMHMLAVDPDCAGRGLAAEMTREAVRTASQRGAQSVRLDVLPGNLPAIGAYTSAGFRYVATIRISYADTGLTDFELYEYVIGRG